MEYIKLGQAISRAKVSRCGDNDYPVLSITMKDGIVMQSDKFKKRIASKDISEYKVIPAGMLVQGIHMDEGNFGIQDIVPYGIVSPAYTVWNVDEAVVFPKYIEMVLRSPRCIAYYRSKLNGTVNRRGHMSDNDFLSMIIPCPSIEEQQHVVATMNQARQVMASLATEMTSLDQLIKARFVEMFGDPEAGTCQFQTERLRDLSVKISDGVHAKPDYTEFGRPFLSVVNINKGVIDFTDCKYVSEEAYQKMIQSTHPQKGDVLYTKVGATYGIPAYVDTEREFCLYVSVCLIKPVHERINARFLALQMAMPSVKHQADARIKGIGVPDLHLNQISEFNIICPPRNLQDVFVHFVEQVDKSKLSVQASLDQLETLKQSLMQKYFG